MSTQTEHLGLKRHTTADVFRIQDYADNWAKLDASPGVFICDSTTRPSNWTVAQTGMLISERDSGLIWRWTGTSFVRVAARGYLGQGVRVSDLLIASSTYGTIVQTPVVIPESGAIDASSLGPGVLRVQIVVSCPQVASTVGLTQMAIFRDSTMLTEWYAKGGDASGGVNPDVYPSNESTVVEDRTPTAGSFNYSLAFRVVPGTGGVSTAKAADNRPIRLTVFEA